MSDPLAAHLPRYQAHNPPPGMWVRETHAEAPVVAFTEPMLAAFARGFVRGFEHWGFPLTGLGHALIDGWLYLRYEDVTDHEEFARRMARVEQVGDLTELRATARTWLGEVIPSVDAARRAIAVAPLATYSAEELATALVDVYSLLVDFAERRMTSLPGTNLLTSAFLVDAQQAGLDRTRCLALLAGSSRATAALSRDAALQHEAAAGEYVDDLCFIDGQLPVAQAMPANPAVSATPAALEPSGEVPAELVAVLADARMAQDVREASRQLFMRLLGRAHRIAHELGARLAAAGTLDAADDVAFLTPAEIVGAHTGLLAGSEARALVRSRRHDVAAAATVVPEPLLGAPIVADNPPPLPAELGEGAMRIFVLATSWMSALDNEPAAQPASADGVMHGVPASAGVVTGPVRLVHGIDDLMAVEPGEIIVCGSTTPAWCVAISISGGLVSTGGGDCCHAAIAAREFAIPAVVGMAAAMRALRTGDVVTLDGGAGTVTTLPG